MWDSTTGEESGRGGERVDQAGHHHTTQRPGSQARHYLHRRLWHYREKSGMDLDDTSHSKNIYILNTNYREVYRYDLNFDNKVSKTY